MTTIQKKADSPIAHLSAEEARDLEAVAAQIIPSDETPGAREAGVIYFIDAALGSFMSANAGVLREGLTALTARVLPSLQRAAGATNVVEIPYMTISEDFAQFGQRVPSFFFTVGVTPVDKDPATAPSNHSSQFFMDEGALPIGVRALLGVTLDYLRSTAVQQGKQ